MSISIRRDGFPDAYDPDVVQSALAGAGYGLTDAYGHGSQWVFVVNTVEERRAIVESVIDAQQVRAYAGSRPPSGGMDLYGSATLLNAVALTSDLGLEYPFVQSAVHNSIARTGRIGMFLPSGTETPAFVIDFDGPAGTELVANPGFEDDFTSWTTTGSTWSNDTSVIKVGLKSAKFSTPLTSTTGTNTSDRISSSISGYAQFLFSFWFYAVEEWATRKVELKWYDAASGGNLLRTDVINLAATQNAWVQVAQSIQAPASALSVEIVATVTSGTAGRTTYSMYFDGFSLSLSTVSRRLYFAPDLTLEGGPLVLSNIASTPATPSAGAFAAHSLNRELKALSGAGQLMTVGLGHRFNTTSDVSNILTETAAVSRIIEGGSLGNYGYVRMCAMLRIGNATGGAVTFTFRFKWGGNTLFSSAILYTSNVSNVGHIVLEFLIQYRGGTSAKNAFGRINQQNVAAPATFAAFSNATELFAYDEGTNVDNTTDQTMEITVQMGTANANASWRVAHATLDGPYYGA